MTVYLGTLLLICAWPQQILGQSAQTQPQQALNEPSQSKPIPLSVLYQFFLSYQSHLDTLATDREEKGEDGNWLRNDLQKRLEFTDAEFAPVRSASQRLTEELNSLKAQGLANQSAGQLPSSPDLLKALEAQREAYIDEEIQYLATALTVERKAALESFLVLFFSPKGTTSKVVTSDGQLAGQAVQP